MAAVGRRVGPLESAAIRHGWFRVRNLHLGTGAVIDQLDTPSSQYLFTRAKQVATYGYTTAGVSLDICEFDPASGAEGPVLSITQYKS